MATLGDLIGALVNSLSHARRIADEETVAIAEYYRSHPLLSGMSVPRVRIPEMRLDLPILLDDHSHPSAARLASSEVITDAVETVLGDVDRHGFVVVPAAMTDVGSRLPDALDELAGQLVLEGRTPVREDVVRVVEQVVASAIWRAALLPPEEQYAGADDEDEPDPGAADLGGVVDEDAVQMRMPEDDLMDPIGPGGGGGGGNDPGGDDDADDRLDIGEGIGGDDEGEGGDGEDAGDGEDDADEEDDPLRVPTLEPAYREMMDAVRGRAAQVALADLGSPAEMTATVVTHAVREAMGAGGEGITRLALVLREEGLDWAVTERDGEVRRHLVAE